MVFLHHGSWNAFLYVLSKLSLLFQIPSLVKKAVLMHKVSTSTDKFAGLIKDFSDEDESGH